MNTNGREWEKELSPIGLISRIGRISGGRTWAAGLCAAILAFLFTSAIAEEEGAGGPEVARQDELELARPVRPKQLPDLTKGHGTGKNVSWNMGPTGIIGVKNGGFAGDQVLVLGVLKGSPAAGKILPGDVILGVQGKDFVAGGHLGLAVGNAIIKAEEEAGRGIFKLHLWRDRNYIKRESRTVEAAKDIDLDKMMEETGKEEEGLYDWKSEKGRDAEVGGFDRFPVDPVHTNITLQLRVMGTYSDTSPWDCPVAEQIREDAWKVLARRGRDGLGSGYSGGWEPAVALVASGKPAYIAAAKEWVHEQKLCQDMNLKVKPKTGIYTSWHAGFGALDMAIYYDATGDKYVLPELRKRAIETAMGQGGCGAWSHSFAFPQEGGKLHRFLTGYGAMHNAGSRCFFLIALAQKLGIKHPEIDAAVERAKLQFGTYVDKCVLGYGGGAGTDDSNGKNCGVTYAFFVLGDTYAAKYFSMHSAHASFTRRGGHGSPVLWYYTPLSAMVAGPRGVQASMRNMRWFHTLARRHDGSFVKQGEQAGIGGKPGFNSTARYALYYSVPLKKTLFSGKDANEACWFTDEEYEELLLAARPQITDPVLLKQIGPPWQERGTDEVIGLLDHWRPGMRQWAGKELAKRYTAGEKAIVAKVWPLLKSDEARMRDGACRALSACGADVVLGHYPKILPLLKDDAEFVRMTAIRAIGVGTKPGDPKREIPILQAAAEDYPNMSDDQGNVRTAAKRVLLVEGSRLVTDPFNAGYDEGTVRAALEAIVTMDPGGTMPEAWNRDTVIKLAGAITFSAEEHELGAGAGRKGQAVALLRKHGYAEAIDGDVSNLRKRQRLERSIRHTAYFKHVNFSGGSLLQGPGLYRDYHDMLYAWFRSNPTGGGMYPLKQMVEVIEKDRATKPFRRIAPDVDAMFQGKLAALGSDAARLQLCRDELKDLQRKNMFRKMSAMTYLAKTLGTKAIHDVVPFLGHERWRLREHAHKLAVDFAGQGETDALISRLKSAKGEHAAGLLDALAQARAKSALSVAKAALESEEPLVRRAAVQAVFAIGGDPELETVFAHMRKATDRDDLYGCEQALLSRHDEPAHVKRVSRACATLLARSKPPLSESLAWVLARFGGKVNFATLAKAITATKDAGERKQLLRALAQSPDPAASDTMLALLKTSNTLRDEVAALAPCRLVGSEKLGDMTDRERVAFAREVMRMKVSSELVTFLGWVPTGDSLALLFDVMKSGKGGGRSNENRDHAARTILNCLEVFSASSKRDARLAREVVTQLIEYIEVKHLRGGADRHVKDWRQASGYAQWKGLQSRAAAILLTLGETKEADVPSIDDPDLDF